MAAGGQAAALGVKRRPFAAKIKKLTINTRATPSRAGGGGGGAQNGKSNFHRLCRFVPCPWISAGVDFSETSVQYSSMYSE